MGSEDHYIPEKDDRYIHISMDDDLYFPLNSIWRLLGLSFMEKNHLGRLLAGD